MMMTEPPSMCPFHDGDFFRRQSIQFICQFINLLVGRVNLALYQDLFVAGFGFCQLLVQGCNDSLGKQLVFTH